MAALIALGSIVLILIVLIDTFETMLLPRRVRRQFQFAHMFYVYSWDPWAAMARRIRSDKRRNTLLSLFGPLSIRTRSQAEGDRCSDKSQVRQH